MRVKDIEYQEECCCCGCSTITVLANDMVEPVLKIVGLRNGKEVYKRLRDAMDTRHQRTLVQFDQK